MSGFRERAAAEIADARPAETLTAMMRGLVEDGRLRLATGPADARIRAQAARQYAIDHMEELHEQLRANFERRVIGYHRADTAVEAVAIVDELLGNARRVAKSKSMVAEEVHLTRILRARGRDVLETDIGEYIVDVEGRGPSHITAPALHLDRNRIRDLLASAGADLPDNDPGRLSRYVRDIVRDYFKDVDAGITGANAVIASSGRLLIVENEGNVALGLTRPKLHIAITGIEKVVADEDAATAILEVLAPSATAQPLTSFTHLVGDPLPGQQRHVVFVDNGRSRVAADERYRDVLRCIRCGACMNACPVYRATSGIPYGSPYMGPIGAVLSPLLWDDGRYADLPSASSLCGACTEACPVGIPLHRMLLDLRADAAEHGTVVERVGWRAWAAGFGGARRGRLAIAAARKLASPAMRLRRAPALDDRKPTAGKPARDPAMLKPSHPPAATIIATEDVAPEEILELLRFRAAQLGADTITEVTEQEGDHVLHAIAAIASTGSVVLVGDAAARGPLLDAHRIVVHVDPATVVRYPSEIADILAAEKGDALILTGASRTADIEKQIVRGIHGADSLVLVLPA